ncbi:MAG: hypothetical protein GTN76_08315 [Candidatus Aenigmarchaeota archaeon]|nr:hypothetical protein [Candidatus Aenigmarchaeota archaeon]
MKIVKPDRIFVKVISTEIIAEPTGRRKGTGSAEILALDFPRFFTRQALTSFDRVGQPKNSVIILMI